MVQKIEVSNLVKASLESPSQAFVHMLFSTGDLFLRCWEAGHFYPWLSTFKETSEYTVSWKVVILILIFMSVFDFRIHCTLLRPISDHLQVNLYRPWQESWKRPN